MASSRVIMWVKMITVGGAVCVGGPAFVNWIRPTDEELFQRYNPDLQKKSLERRYEKEKEFDDFVMRLKEYSKSDKPIWIVQAEAIKKEKEEKRRQELKDAEETKARQEALRKEAGLPGKAGPSKKAEPSEKAKEPESK